MKKILIIILVVLFSGMSAYSQCEPGYEKFEARITLSDLCEYDVVICYKCDPISIPVYKIWAFHKVDPDCESDLDPSEVLEEIPSKLFTEENLRDMCGPIEINPCGQPGNIQFVVTYPGCCYKSNHIEGGLWYIECNVDDRTCTQIIELCWDPIELEYKYAVIDSDFYSDPEACTPEDLEPVDPPVGQDTGCFYVETPCEKPPIP